MIKQLFIFSAVLLTAHASAQSLSPTVQASSGDYSVSPNASLSWTLGETATETYTSANNQLTQGFQQAELIITGIENPNEAISVTIYPNPSAGQVSIKFTLTEARKVELNVMDITGKLVSTQQQDISAGVQILSTDLTSLAAGKYLLVITDREKKTSSTYHIEKTH
jgi:hypothetical protein